MSTLQKMCTSPDHQKQGLYEYRYNPSLYDDEDVLRNLKRTSLSLFITLS